MPHYFLHVRDGNHVQKDEEGEWSSDLEAARAGALETAREMWAEVLRYGEGRDFLDAVFIITVKKDRELMIVSFVDALPPRLRIVFVSAG